MFKSYICNFKIGLEADEVFIWLINVVKDNVVKLSKRNEELLELSESITI